MLLLVAMAALVVGFAVQRGDHSILDPLTEVVKEEETDM